MAGKNMGACKHNHTPFVSSRCLKCRLLDRIRFCVGWWDVYATAHIEPIMISYKGREIHESTLLVWSIGLVVFNDLPLRLDPNTHDIIRKYEFGWPWCYRYTTVVHVGASRH